MRFSLSPREAESSTLLHKRSDSVGGKQVTGGKSTRAAVHRHRLADEPPARRRAVREHDDDDEHHQHPADDGPERRRLFAHRVFVGFGAAALVSVNERIA